MDSVKFSSLSFINSSIDVIELSILIICKETWHPYRIYHFVCPCQLLKVHALYIQSYEISIKNMKNKFMWLLNTGILLPKFLIRSLKWNLSFRYTCTPSQQSRNLPDTLSPEQSLDHSLSWLYDSVHAYVSISTCILICSIYIIQIKVSSIMKLKDALYILKMSISTV